MRDAELWNRIAGYGFAPLPGAPALPGEAGDAGSCLAHVLARLDGWTPDLATRAMLEYRRYVYLLCIAPGTAPSDPVALVWRLHRGSPGYRQDFLARHLGRPLPVIAPAPDGQCRNPGTAGLYGREFGELPPPALWPGLRPPAGAAPSGGPLRRILSALRATFGWASAPGALPAKLPKPGGEDAAALPGCPILPELSRCAQHCPLGRERPDRARPRP